MLSTKLKEAAGNSADATLYVDDVFSTWLYNSDPSGTNTITNGIDLAGKGGMVWIKSRSAATSHKLTDTVRGATKALVSNTAAAQTTDTFGLTAFNSNGFLLGDNSAYNDGSGATYASWTFREAAKFFDVVTYTGTGSARTIAHSLGIAPGMVIVKCINNSTNWQVYSNGLTSAAYSIQLNSTNTEASAPTVWNSTAPTSSVFSVGTDSSVNNSGSPYVAYLFAHDTSSTGIIQCGSFTTDSSGNATVNLGWEPQFILIKNSSEYPNWHIVDNMRGFFASNPPNVLNPNTSGAESSGAAPQYGDFEVTSTGFKSVGNYSSNNYIYMAIRRPNKPPTSGTQVFGLNARTGTGANATVTGGQTDDAVLIKNRGSAVGDLFSSRLTGTGYLVTSSTAAEVAAGTTILQANPWDVMDGVKVGTTSTITNASANTFINYMFKRAPGFFDEVCYTGTGSAMTVAHNLTVAPEFIIVKNRSNVNNWPTYSAYVVQEAQYRINLNSTSGSSPTGESVWGATPTTVPNMTSTTFSLGTEGTVNTSLYTYVAYLFATLAGISKVGSYTGNGSTGQAIACGFSAGARFVLIRRSDINGGNWYTFDSARGLTSVSSPYLLLNSTAAEVTGNNGVYASTGGFTLGSTASTTTNINAATYIFLAVA